MPPSGLKATLATPSRGLWAVNGVPRRFWLRTSHSWTVPSSVPEATIRPSGLIAIPPTPFVRVWRRTPIGLRVRTSQSRTDAFVSP